MLQRSPHDLSAVATLFTGCDHHLAVRALLSGAVSGRALADDARQPSGGVLQAGRRLFFGGAPTPAFLDNLLAWLEATGFPESLARGYNILTIYHAPDAWLDPLLEGLADRYPIATARECYEGATAPCEPVAPSEGFALLPVDEALLDSGLDGLNDLREEMCSERASVEEWLAHSVGVCAVHEGALAGWCLSEYDVPGRCEVGIETRGPYRRRGLATAMTTTLLAELHRRGVERVGWHCYASNVASAATARKAGLIKALDYTAYEVWADRTWGLAVNGNLALLDGRPAEALDWLELAIARGGAHRWIYFRAVCAAGALGRDEEALGYLGEAISRGYRDRHSLESAPELSALRCLAAFRELLASME